MVKRDIIQIHGVTITLQPDGSIEASGDNATVKSSSVESILMFFMLRELQALNGALRDGRPPTRISSSAGIFPS